MSDSETDGENGDLLEQLLRRHRKQKKELQARVQTLKKLSSKGDKKKKKETTDEISRLETELTEQQEAEIAALKSDGRGESGTVARPPADDDDDDMSRAAADGVARISLSESRDEEDRTSEATNRRVSKAQKRRDKKEQLERNREEEIREQKKLNVIGPKYIETSRIKELLKLRNLEMVDVASDGDCLFSAVLYQVLPLQCPTRPSKDDVRRLRAQTADKLRSSKDRFLPFLVDSVTGLQFDDDRFEAYCHEMATTRAWGGQVELGAIADIIDREIVVIQAEGAPISIVGEERSGSGVDAASQPSGRNEPVVVTYHRHYLGLGEHYNSTRPVRSIESGSGSRTEDDEE